MNKNIIDFIDNNKRNNLNISNKNKRRISKEKINEEKDTNEKNKIIKEISYLHILKSFLCFKDQRTKLIDLSHNIIIQDLSVERILKRFYDLEKLNQSEGNVGINVINVKRFKEIDQYIDNIIKDLKKENNSNNEKTEKNSENENKLNSLAT